MGWRGLQSGLGDFLECQPICILFENALKSGDKLATNPLERLVLSL